MIGRLTAKPNGGFNWVVEGNLAPIWQTQSGQSGKFCNLANLAIWQFPLSGQSGKHHTDCRQPIWQPDQSGNSYFNSCLRAPSLLLPLSGFLPNLAIWQEDQSGTPPPIWHQSKSGNLANSTIGHPIWHMEQSGVNTLFQSGKPCHLANHTHPIMYSLGWQTI